MTLKAKISSGYRRSRLVRGVLAGVLVFLSMWAALPGSASGQDNPNSWTDPKGEFTVEWTSPWTAMRLDDEAVGLSNGAAIVSTTESGPVQNAAPFRCLDALFSLTTGQSLRADLLRDFGVTTWRAFAVFDVPEAGMVSYLECQVTPSGDSFAYIIGGVNANQESVGLPAIKELASSWIVRESGEVGPALAADGWRVGLVNWSRGAVFGDYGLPPALAGSEYVLILADIVNWQAASEEFPLDLLTIELPGESGPVPADLPASMILASTLGEQPGDVLGRVAIPTGESRRVALVFSVPSVEEAAFTVSLGDAHMSLEDRAGFELLPLAPPPRELAPLEPGVITGVTDGRTIRVRLDSTGENERVRLIGLADPADDAATSHLESYVGQQVNLERDPAVPDDARLQRYVWVGESGATPELLNATLVEAQLAEVDPGQANARFSAMMSAAQPSEPAGPTAEDPGEELAPETAALTETEQDYLTAMVEQNELIKLTLQNFDAYTAAPTLDEAFYNRMILIFQGWSIAYDGVSGVDPPPALADLHARYLASLEPFDALAHQLLPELDQWFAGEVNALQLVGFDVQTVTTFVESTRLSLETVMLEIDLMATSA